MRTDRLGIALLRICTGQLHHKASNYHCASYLQTTILLKNVFKYPGMFPFLLHLKWQPKNFLSWHSYLFTIHPRSLSFSSASLLLRKRRKMSRRACQALVAARGSGATRVCVWVRPGTEWAGHHIHSPPVPRLLHLPRHLRHHATCVAAYTETAFCTRLPCMIFSFI